MQPILTVSEMQAADAAAQVTTPLRVLVERAGIATGGAALGLMGTAYGRRVVVVAGKGNNGADGRVAAGFLQRRGALVTVVEAGSPHAIPACDLVIDAAYGTGFRGEYRAPSVPGGTPILAVDIPSGIGGDTGRASGTVLAADQTVTFAALKPGLLQGDGLDLSGQIRIADIGLPIGTARSHLIEDPDFALLVPARRRDGNKWSSAVLVVAGSPGMTGAAGLCARAAFRAGAGMVRLGVPGAELGDSPAAEAVSISLPARGWADAALLQADRCDAIVVGPGLGRDPATAGEVRRLVSGSELPVVVDADGLFALGRLDGSRPLRSKPTVVLTPHDGEFRRLVGEPPGPDRIEASRRLAAVAGTVALLKGGTTVVADPSGRVLVSTAGSPRLATAGTGDVLSGVIGAFLARGAAPVEAAAIAAHVHGRAADLGRPEGLMAGDLPDLVSTVLSGLRTVETSHG